MKVRYSRRALNEIDEILDYIAAENPRTADAAARRQDWHAGR